MTNEAANGMEKPSNRKKRMRSPNYPMFSLAEAINKIKVIFDHEKRNPTPPDVLLQHLGYTKDSGTGGRALSALRQFGLLEDQSGNLMVSSLAFSLLYSDEGSIDREECLQVAASKPSIFSELVASFPDGLPSDASLKSFLVTKKGFNPDSVAEFIKVFKETMGLAKIVPGEYDVTAAGGLNMATQEQESVRSTGSTPSLQVQVFNYGLSQDRKVRAEVKLTGQELKKEDVELLIAYLDLMKKSFKEGN